MKRKIIALLILAIIIVSTNISVFAATSYDICPECGAWSFGEYCANSIYSVITKPCDGSDGCPAPACILTITYYYAVLGCDNCRYCYNDQYSYHEEWREHTTGKGYFVCDLIPW